MNSTGVYIVEQLVNGICQGSIYALTAIGYATIVGVAGLVNFAYGDVVMMGAFGAYYGAMFFGNHLVLGLIAGFVTSGLIGLLVHKICYERFLNAPGYVSLLCLISMSMIIRSIAQIVFNPESKAYPQFVVLKTIKIGPVSVTMLQIIIISIVIVLSIALTVFLKTRYGMMLRAVRLDKKAATLTGINVSKMTAIGCLLGYGIAGMSGVLLGVYYGLISPILGVGVGMKAFSGSALGGMTNIAASALGGVIVGILENLGIVFISAAFRDVIAFVFLIVVLIIMPNGIKLKLKRTKVTE